MSKKIIQGVRMQRGAALLLMLMMLVLASAAFSMRAFSQLAIDRSREKATLDKLAAAQEALLGYALRHGQLPRPAISLSDGNQKITPCETEQVCTGFLPWVTLGIDGRDGWGRTLRYSVSSAFTAPQIVRNSTVATKRIQGRNSKGELFFLAGTGLCTLNTQCLPAIIFSSGKNPLGTSGSDLTLLSGNPMPVDELQNWISYDHFIRRPFNDDPDSPGGRFDDLIAAITLEKLYQRMHAAGAIQ